MKKLNIGINGFGRIGKCVLRAYFEGDYSKYFSICQINAPSENKIYAHLLQYDSVHGKFLEEVTYDDNHLIISQNKIPKSSYKNINDISWDNIDIVLECSGKFNSKKEASAHFSDSVKTVIVSAPCDEADLTIVHSVNNHLLSSIQDNMVVSIGSCTTNCLAPIANILHNAVGIEKGFVTTFHAYTNDQNILDVAHKDLRRARACNLSLIPTSTGAAKAIGLVLPELSGKLDGSAVRAPIPNVSMIDFSFLSSKDTSSKEINNIMEQYAKNDSSNIVGFLKDPLVSIDMNHTTYSAIFDPFETKVVDNNFVRILAWYDNEWAYSCRLLDSVKQIAIEKNAK